MDSLEATNMRTVKDRRDNSEAEFDVKEHLTELLGRVKVGNLLELVEFLNAMSGEKALKERWEEMKNKMAHLILHLQS